MRKSGGRRQAVPIVAAAILGGGILSVIAGCESPVPRDSIINIFFDRAPARVFSGSTVSVVGSVATVVRRPSVKHVPYAKEKCSRCHGAPGPSAGSAFAADREAPAVGFNFTAVDPSSFRTAGKRCLTCHANPKEVGPKALIAPSGAWLHAPVANLECVRCHDPHESPNPHLLKRERVEPLCLGCHENQPRTEVMKKLDCAECHDCHMDRDPEARTHAFLAESQPGELCLRCHDTPEKPFKDPARPWLHAPVANGACTACHSTHSGDAHAVKRPLRNACLACHDAASIDQRPEHKQAAQQDCDRCHDPHAAASPAEHFLRAR